MRISEYKELFVGGNVSSVDGLCGRIIRGTKASDFETLTDDPDRRLVMLMGSDGLEKLLGKSGYVMLEEIGYETDYIERKVQEGNEFKLVVFEEGGEAKWATWDNMLEVVTAVYPQIAAKLYQNLEGLKQVPFNVIEKQAGYDFSEVDKNGKSDPRYMSIERFEQAGNGLIEARAFLYFTVHLRELYSGDGYTYTPDGKRGLKEYIVANKPIKELGGNEIIDIKVEIPSKTTVSGGKQMTNTNYLPSFYKPESAENFNYLPDKLQMLTWANEWREKMKIPFAGTDRYKIHLLGIDMQKDFCFPEGTLYVAGRSGTGAIDDNKRFAEFIYRNLSVITETTFTMDTHFAFQIFFAQFWVDVNGNPLEAHSIITTEMIRRGEAKPNPAVAWWLCNGNYTWLLKQVEFYCEELEKAGKYELYLWPLHCDLGSDGHALAGVIQEARLFHSLVRGTQTWSEVKGGNPLTENYSVFRPEVLMRYDGHPLAQKNSKFLKKLFATDALIIGGQAASHCVKSTIDDLLDEIIIQDPKMVQKVYILEDCMSAVTVPDGKGGFAVDFTPQAEDSIKRFADAGMNIVKSTDPIETWPGIRL